jgi:hypothetical protein
MANQNPKGKQKYWYNGVATTLIKPKINVSIGSQNYWYNGQSQGYLINYKEDIIYIPRVYSILVGF